MTIGIYSIQCKANNKMYIGRAINIEDRRGVHLWKLRKNIHPNKSMQTDFKRYGESKFIFRILRECSLEEMLYAEMELILQMRPVYNQTVGPGTLGYKHTDLTKKKISKGVFERFSIKRNKEKK